MNSFGQVFGQLLGFFCFIGILIFIYRITEKSSTHSKKNDYYKTSSTEHHFQQTHPSTSKRYRDDLELLEDLRQMHPTQFEHFIADLFTRLGFEAKAVGGIHDEGIDVIVKKDGITDYYSGPLRPDSF
jgi:HJR/Mrr/RecB family endonuclease